MKYETLPLSEENCILQSRRLFLCLQFPPFCLPKLPPSSMHHKQFWLDSYSLPRSAAWILLPEVLLWVCKSLHPSHCSRLFDCWVQSQTVQNWNQDWRIRVQSCRYSHWGPRSWCPGDQSHRFCPEEIHQFPECWRDARSWGSRHWPDPEIWSCRSNCETCRCQDPSSCGTWSSRWTHSTFLTYWQSRTGRWYSDRPRLVLEKTMFRFGNKIYWLL